MPVSRDIPVHTDEDLRFDDPAPQMLHHAEGAAKADISTSYDTAERTQPLRHPTKTLRERTSLASVGRDSLLSSGDEEGYTTDVTMSTLPPSYRRHCSIPDMHSLSISLSASASQDVSPAIISSPPPVFMRTGRRMRRDYPARGERAARASRRRASASSERPGTIPAPPGGESSGMRQALGDADDIGRSRSRQPKKSVDGGVRFAGGLPDMPAGDEENPFEAYAYETASTSSAPSYRTEF
ncbi:hypothetical protein TRAPUB_9377 [Trametes pubescens]|uniref:Uncharacterized protein n=1 Tax=Trametes pubescens TaxID=154538 RepID=A0A1M2W2J4_TRAPU|nr:hypothetical protein TRAPUB_9377 [Trametes pubescens]